MGRHFLVFLVQYLRLINRSNFKFSIMARAIYEYTKAVLQKVSFSSELFCKELEKAIHMLLPFEVNELLIWVKQYTIDKPELQVCLRQLKT